MHGEESALVVITPVAVGVADSSTRWFPAMTVGRGARCAGGAQVRRVGVAGRSQVPVPKRTEVAPLKKR